MAITARVITRERLAAMLVFVHTHRRQAERSYNLDRTIAWNDLQDRLLELWAR